MSILDQTNPVTSLTDLFTTEKHRSRNTFPYIYITNFLNLKVLNTGIWV